MVDAGQEERADGLESPRPRMLSKAVARSPSVRLYTDTRNMLMALYLSVDGGDVMTDNALFAVLVSNAATTW